jgi:hypothetical protein
MEEMLTEKAHQQTFLYDTKLPDYKGQHMRTNTWEGIGKELKIKRKFYVSSRDMRIVCPRLKSQPLVTLTVFQLQKKEENESNRCKF